MSWDSAYRGMWEQADWKHPINSTLNGTDGRRYGYQNEDSAIENTVKEPINGNTIVTTIDANLQSIVEKHLEEFNQAHTDEAQEGWDLKTEL